MHDKKKTNKQTSVKLVALTILMFGFGFSLIPFYEAICEVTGINILAARDKSDVRAEEIDREAVDYTRQVIVEFDSNTHGPWTFEAEKSSVTVHPGELVVVEFEVTNPSTMKSSGQAIPSYAPLKAGAYLKKLECFCFEQQDLEAGETRLFPVAFFIYSEIPEDITNITMSYTFFELLSSYGYDKRIVKFSNHGLFLNKKDARLREPQDNFMLSTS
jgi:cytochrome c oxidase assembly protein subunit 11